MATQCRGVEQTTDTRGILRDAGGTDPVARCGGVLAATGSDDKIMAHDKVPIVAKKPVMTTRRALGRPRLALTGREPSPGWRAD